MKGGSSSGGHVYSTEEHVVGKWIDGRDVYEFTLNRDDNSGMSPGHARQYGPFEEFNDLDFVINIGGSFMRTEGEYYPIPFASGSTNSWRVFAMYSARLIFVNSIGGNDDYYNQLRNDRVTIRYVKKST